jgi:hypothetical protein
MSMPSAGAPVPPVVDIEIASDIRKVCDSQLQLLSAALQQGGTVIAGVHIRVPSSLETGALHLQRVAWTGDKLGDVDQGQAIMIGGGSSTLTEEHIVSQRTLSLPSHGHVVLPLAHNSFLVWICRPLVGCLTFTKHIACPQ